MRRCTSDTAPRSAHTNPQASTRRASGKFHNCRKNLQRRGSNLTWPAEPASARVRAAVAVPGQNPSTKLPSTADNYPRSSCTTSPVPPKRWVDTCRTCRRPRRRTSNTTKLQPESHLHLPGAVPAPGAPRSLAYHCPAAPGGQAARCWRHPVTRRPPPPPRPRRCQSRTTSHDRTPRTAPGTRCTSDSTTERACTLDKCRHDDAIRPSNMSCRVCPYGPPSCPPAYS